MSKAEVVAPLCCLDCLKPYSNFPLDSTLPNEQWRMIHDGDGGVLCANCMVARAAKLPGAVALRMRIEFSPTSPLLDKDATGHTTALPLFQKQTILNHNPAEGIYGDCFRASIASLLCLPINEVPHFCDGVDKDDTAWFDLVNRWLGERGLAYIEFTGGNGWEDTFRRLDCYHTIAGPSPRHANTLHSVIGRNGAIVFDPHPSDAGLATSEEPYIYGLLVVTNASLLAVHQEARQ